MVPANRYTLHQLTYFQLLGAKNKTYRAYPMFRLIFSSSESRLDCADSVVLQSHFGELGMRFGFPLAAATLLLATSLTTPLCAETADSGEDKRQTAAAFVAERLAVWQK